MNLSTEQRRRMQQVVNVFETGKPEGDYATIAIYHDGPHDIRQITYGRSQTTEYGNLRRLVHMYVDAGGLCSKELRAYAERVGSTSLVDDAEFKALLRLAGREDPAMRRIQDRFFDQAYLRPAMKWADDQGFKRALSALVIYDSFVHSGRVLWVIRNMFPESPPSLGGKEETWVSQYVNARHRWLGQHARAAVRATTYRTACFKREINRSNWDLKTAPIIANGVRVL
jgi:chitosanase